MPKNFEEPYRYTQNRELSWLHFDRRVLEEAADPGVPALERLKFVSIFSSNLDEFFMVRVGSLFDLARMTPDNTDNKTGWTPAEQLHHIYRVIPGLLSMKKQIYAAVMDELARSGMQDVLPEALGTDDLKQINRFFKTELLPVLSPIVIGPNHPVPHLVNKKLYAAALLESKNQAKVIQNAARYLTSAAQGSIGGTNSYDNRKTYNQNASTTIQVDKLVVRDEQDVRSLAIEIAGLTKRQQRGKGMRFA